MKDILTGIFLTIVAIAVVSWLNPIEKEKQISDKYGMENGIKYSEDARKEGTVTDYIAGQVLKIPSKKAANRKIKEGSHVVLKADAKTYTGGGLAPYVYKRTHIVKELKNDRAVITYKGVIVAAVNVNDLTLV